MGRIMQELKEVDKKTESEVKEGKYIYCIIQTDQPRNFGPIGIGSRGDEVYTINYEDLASIVSNSPITKYPITRENTIAHQKVLEEVMSDYTILPVRFCTITDSKDNSIDLEEKIKEKLLKERYSEFKELLNYMDDKVELGLKAIWNNIDAVFEEVLKENAEIRGLREILINNAPEKTYYERIKLGEMVRNALDEKKERETKRIFEALKKLSIDTRNNKVFGDKMVLNSAFLVNNSNQEAFDDEVNNLEKRYDGKMRFKYVGPVPPYNFVEIVVVLE